MKFFLVVFSSLVLATLVRADEPKAFVYEHGMIAGQAKEKAVRMKVAVSRFETAFVEGSPFNPPVEDVSSTAKDINVKIDDSLGVLEAEMRKEDKYTDADLLTGLLTDKLRRSDFFDIVERQDINEIIKEINFQNSNWVKQENVNKLGNISPVQYLLMGKLLMNRNRHVVALSRYTLSLRLANVNTGEIISSSTGEYNTVEGAVDEAVSKLAEEIHTLPWTARIAKVDGPAVLINAGFVDHLKQGDAFAVIRLGEEVKDPITQTGLGLAKTEIGMLRVEEVLENNLSKVKIVSQKEGINVGDIVSARAPNQKPDEAKQWHEIFGK